MSDARDTSDPSTSPGAVPGRAFPLSIDAAGLPRAGTTIGVALAGAAIAVSAMFARERGDLDGPIFAVGVVASLLLLALSGWTQVATPASERAADLVSWPGAAGAFGTGLMLAVALDAENTGVYAAAGVVLVLGVAGYLLTAATPFVLTVLGALAVLYIQAFEDLLGFDDPYQMDGDGDTMFIATGAAICAFVVVVTVAGWFLPRTRVLTGVLTGLGGLVALTGVMQLLMISRVFSSIDEGFSEEFDEDMSGEYLSPDSEEFSEPDFEDMGPGRYGDFIENSPYRDDVYIILAFCALLGVFWVACSLVTGHVGFRLLVVADAVAMIPLALFALASSHAAWWGTGLGIAGLAALAAAAYRARPGTPEPAADPQ